MSQLLRCQRRRWSVKSVSGSATIAHMASRRQIGIRPSWSWKWLHPGPSGSRNQKEKRRLENGQEQSMQQDLMADLGQEGERTSGKVGDLFEDFGVVWSEDDQQHQHQLMARSHKSMSLEDDTMLGDFGPQMKGHVMADAQDQDYFSSPITAPPPSTAESFPQPRLLSPQPSPPMIPLIVVYPPSPILARSLPLENELQDSYSKVDRSLLSDYMATSFEDTENGTSPPGISLFLDPDLPTREIFQDLADTITRLDTPETEQVVKELGIHEGHDNDPESLPLATGHLAVASGPDEAHEARKDSTNDGENMTAVKVIDMDMDSAVGAPGEDSGPEAESEQEEYGSPGSPYWSPGSPSGSLLGSPPPLLPPSLEVLCLPPPAAPKPVLPRLVDPPTNSSIASQAQHWIRQFESFASGTNHLALDAQPELSLSTLLISPSTIDNTQLSTAPPIIMKMRMVMMTMMIQLYQHWKLSSDSRPKS